MVRTHSLCALPWPPGPSRQPPTRPSQQANSQSARNVLWNFPLVLSPRLLHAGNRYVGFTPKKVFLNDGSGRLVYHPESGLGSEASGSHAVLLRDLDMDGALDVYAANGRDHGSELYAPSLLLFPLARPPQAVRGTASGSRR